MHDGPPAHAIVPADAPALTAILAAVEPAGVAVSRVGSVLEAAADARLASAHGAEWLWLLDGSAVPRPDALAQLLEAAGTLGSLPAPSLLAAKVVDERGELALDLAPWYLRGQPDLTMSAAARRVLPVRAARLGCVLVRPDAAAAAGRPLAGLDAAGAALEWTARILQRGVGYLVPAAVADVARDRPTAEDARDQLRTGAAMLLSPAFAPRERLWLGAQVAAGARGALVAGDARPAGLLQAGARGAVTALRARGAARDRP